MIELLLRTRFLENILLSLCGSLVRIRFAPHYNTFASGAQTQVLWSN